MWRVEVYREERKAKSEKRPSSYNHLVLPIVLGAAGLAGLATWAGFQTMWPTSQVCGSTFIGLPRGSRQLALTYDDGPNDPYTWRMMEVLERHGVKATFFLLGSFVQQKPEIARALVAAGHAIGSHTWDHPNLIFASSAKIRRQLQQTRQAISRRDRRRPHDLSSAVWWATSRIAAHCARNGTTACHVECQLL